MMCLEANMIGMKYAKFIKKDHRYDTDDDWNPIVEYVMDDGTPIYKALEYETMDYYEEPKDMQVSVAESGGEAEAMAFGLSVADYEAVMIYERGKYPLEIGSIVWFGDSTVEYEYNGKEVPIDTKDGKQIMSRIPDKTSADYTVIKIVRSLNFTKAVLKAIVK